MLQISSSLDWRSIRAGGKQLQFVSQPYTSDIDHTGALSEAIVTLPAGSRAQGHRRSGDRLRRRDRAGRDAAHAASALPKRRPTAATGTRSTRNSQRCAERDTWRGIRSRPKLRSFRRQQSVRGSGPVEGARGSLDDALEDQRVRDDGERPARTSGQRGVVPRDV